ncbi:hypothetical protein MKK75_08515 [Methylobacterium sp. J-030]|uniref:hypothetical protein n=1 Tax=Methylobacterium sp. J-030 TaxID=2836627 RepID=UPI001FBA4B85|nr:hypothetical protein [Methylobacterium sp. J-030]MCJ2068842.1 hypothetical protein [Methylobacterium sp. J-030]
MAKDGHVPAWLARRTYFKRIGRWVKPGKARGTGPAPEAEAAPLVSNVVPFPVRMERSDRLDFAGRLNIGIA